MKMTPDKVNELIQHGIIGHVHISDRDTGEVIVDAFNAINYENACLTMARALANSSEGHLHEMHFGNGASSVSGTGAITYFPPNVLGRDADLYNSTYYKVVDDLSSLNVNPDENSVDVINLPAGLRYADIRVTCTLNENEPAGQYAFDDATDLESDFVFDEIGLKAFSPRGPGKGLLFSHVIFSPVQKSLNRAWVIRYTIRIAMC